MMTREAIRAACPGVHCQSCDGHSCDDRPEGARHCACCTDTAEAYHDLVERVEALRDELRKPHQCNGCDGIANQLDAIVTGETR